MTDGDDPPVKRRGPAPRGPFTGKRKTLTTRITEGVREQLEAAAEASDRSLSQEIEFRLERSFLTEEAIRDRELSTFGGAHTHALVRLLGDLIKGTEFQTSGSWADDQYTFDQVCLSIETFLGALRPSEPDDGRPRLVDNLVETDTVNELSPEIEAELKNLRNTIGVAMALGKLDQLKLADKHGSLEHGHVRSDTLQLHYDAAPVIAPLIRRDKN